MSDNTTNQDTVIPTIHPGIGVRVVIGGDGAIHLTRTDESGSWGGLVPAEARRLAALLLGAASELDDVGTDADFAALIDLIRRHDAQLGVLYSRPPDKPGH